MPETIYERIFWDDSSRPFYAFVDSIDLAKLGFDHFVFELYGPVRPSHNSRDMLKLDLWDYFDVIRSPSKFQGECRRNLEVIWTINNVTLNFKTVEQISGRAM